jgi:hypothetical protein
MVVRKLHGVQTHQDGSMQVVRGRDGHGGTQAAWAGVEMDQDGSTQATR